MDLGVGPSVSVSHLVMHTRPVEFVAGFYPNGLTVYLIPEPGDRLETAEAAGWRPIAAEP